MSSSFIFSEVRTPEGDLNVCEAGAADAATIVFVHGYPDTHRVWQPVMNALAGEFHVVAYDVRGAGESFEPADEAGYRMALLNSDLAAVIDAKAHAETIHLVGHDWGSIQSWSFLSDARFADRVASFTSLSGLHLGVARAWFEKRLRSLRPAEVADALRQATRSSYMAVFRSNLGPRLADLTSSLAESSIGAGLRARLGVPDYPLGARERARTARNGLSLYRANMGDEFPAAPAAAIATPTQLIIAENDPFLTPPFFDSSSDYVEQLWVRRIDAGHWAITEDPSQIAAWIAEFVNAQATGSTPLPLARAEQRSNRREFDDHLVLVTGAGSGIGRETAFGFAELGAELVLCDIDKEGLDRTGELADLIGAPSVHAEVVDVADRDAMRDFAATVHTEHGIVDVLVNNAGIGIAGKFVDTSLEDWDRIIGINLLGVVHGCHYFGREMVERGDGGHIVNVASAAAYMPSDALPAYATTKAGVLGLSENLRVEFAKAGIGVSAICPGIINTNITRSTQLVGDVDHDELREQFVRLYARRNFGPEKVATAIIDAVRENRGVVPVAPEATVGYYLKRALPGVVERFAGSDRRP